MKSCLGLIMRTRVGVQLLARMNRLPILTSIYRFSERCGPGISNICPVIRAFRLLGSCKMPIRPSASRQPVHPADEVVDIEVFLRMQYCCKSFFNTFYGPTYLSLVFRSYLGTEEGGLYVQPAAGFTEKRELIIVSTAISSCFNFSASSSHIIIPYPTPKNLSATKARYSKYALLEPFIAPYLP